MKVSQYKFQALILLIIMNILFSSEASCQGLTGTHILKISGFQMNVTNDIEQNKAQILEGIKFASEEGSDFLVTPEGSLSGYTDQFDQNKVSGALKEIVTKASESKVGLFLGTCYKEKTGGIEYCYNQVRVYSQEGQHLGAYSKILRCSSLSLPGSGEMTSYIEGVLKVFELKGCRLGILICNDLWATPGYTTMPNPYLPWKLKQMGAQMIIHCINSGTAQRYRNFHESSASLWAYSLNIPILEVNAAHGNEIINASSGLIEATGERPQKVNDSGNQLFTVTLNLNE